MVKDKNKKTDFLSPILPKRYENTDVEVIFYETATGNSPVEKFITKDLNASQKEEVMAALSVLVSLVFRLNDILNNFLAVNLPCTISWCRVFLHHQLIDFYEK